MAGAIATRSLRATEADPSIWGMQGDREEHTPELAQDRGRGADKGLPRQVGVRNVPSLPYLPSSPLPPPWDQVMPRRSHHAGQEASSPSALAPELANLNNRL